MLTNPTNSVAADKVKLRYVFPKDNIMLEERNMLNALDSAGSVTRKISSIKWVLLRLFFRKDAKSDGIFYFSDFIKIGCSTDHLALLSLVLDLIEILL